MRRSRAVYFLSWTILARGSNETAIEKRSSRPQVSVKRCNGMLGAGLKSVPSLAVESGFLRSQAPAVTTCTRSSTISVSADSSASWLLVSTTGQSNSAELPTRLRGKEIAVGPTHVADGRCARPAAQDVLIAHELSVVFTKRAARCFISRIRRIRTRCPFPDVSVQIPECGRGRGLVARMNRSAGIHQ